MIPIALSRRPILVSVLILCSGDGRHTLCHLRNRLHSRGQLDSGLNFEFAKLQVVFVFEQYTLGFVVEFSELLRRILACELLKDLLPSCGQPIVTRCMTR